MRFFIFSACLILSFYAGAQTLSPINLAEVTRIEDALAADSMQGRQVFTPGIEKAASFISNEFKAAGLEPLTGANSYEQTFKMVNSESTRINAIFDGHPADGKNVVAFTADSSLTVTNESNYKKIYIKSQNDFTSVFFKYFDADENVIVFVDTAFRKRFARLAGFHMPQFKGSSNRIFILCAVSPGQYSIQVKQKLSEQVLTNLVGMIPGKTKPDEYVIFSAHYDHLGIGIPDAGGDSIYNGANDDASGTTAVITLAKYFNQLNNNQRTLLFVAFTAEEIGEFGSAYFSNKLDPSKAIAMFNIEMIGTESKWGINSAYITGYEKTDMGAILQKNLLNTQFRFYPDPYPDQNLFLRSDNASLAKKGVPAHTISTSKMDSEKYYHQLGDEVKTLDLKNMTEIIHSIGISSRTLVSGEDTPRRVSLE
jgi:Zn-dependent M28 family amino/carboxypeptidase